MNNFKDKVRTLTTKALEKKNRRYYGAVLVLVFMAMLLSMGMKDTAGASNPTAGVYGSFQNDEKKELNTLIKNYYKDYAKGDTEGIAKEASPLSEGEASYIKFFSQYVEKYQNIKVYYKQGLDKNSYLVSVYLEIKFKDIDTAAPGLDFFYISTDKKGNLYINNRYSAYNTANSDYKMNTKIAKLIAAFEQQDDVTALQAKVQEKFNEAVLKDEKLNSFVTSTLQDATSKWAADYKKKVQDDKDAKTAEKNVTAKIKAIGKVTADSATAISDARTAYDALTDEQKKAIKNYDTLTAAETALSQIQAKAASDQAAAQAAADQAAATTVYTNSKVNVRDSASETGNLLGQIDAATAVTKYADEGEWSRISYNGGNGYIKTQFLTADQAAAQAAASTAVSTGKVTLSSTVNIRSSMSESSSKVAVAYSGEQVTVEQSYSEGWTKVSYNGKEGYVKSDYLK